MADPMTKAELLTQVRAAKDAAEATIARVPIGRFGEPGPNGDWSAKDELAHLTFWNEKLLMRLRAATSGIAPDPDAFAGSDDEIDAVNARCLAEHKDQPLDDVLAAFHATHAEAEETIAAHSEEDLFDPARFAWAHGTPLWHWIAGNITEHYPEHIGQIDVWLAAQPAARAR